MIKTFLRNSLLLVVILLFISYKTVKSREVPVAPETAKELSFPDAYFGIYKGDLTIVNANGEDIIPMEFHLLPTETEGTYHYIIVYIIDGNRQERNYTLKAENAEKGNYIVDENNGILLDAKVLDNKLYSMFEVQGNILTTNLTFFEDDMIFEITFSSKKAARVSGTAGEYPIEVISYPISTVQKGILQKQ